MTSNVLSVVKVYCILAAVFFAACAYAQLNDPDPVMWILGYVLGGCVYNILVITKYPVSTKGDDRSGFHIMWYITFMDIFSILNVSAIIYILMTLLPRTDPSLPLRELAWSVLELEEGREVAGLFLLFLHVLKLRGYLTESTGEEMTKNPIVSRYGHVGTAVMIGAIICAVYLWVYYQPEMNARYQTGHCDGVFSSGDNRVGDVPTDS